jgi:predicted CXXCH cytochrome family protein
VPIGIPFRFSRSTERTIALIVFLVAASTPLSAAETGEPNDHIGKSLPDYVTGDECLFCHRNDIASGWKINTHQLTLRPLVAAPNTNKALESETDLQPFARQVQFILGHKEQLRLLKKSTAYGQLDLLSALLAPSPSDKKKILVENEGPFHWNHNTFSQRCAGCHTTAVDSQTQSFSATSIDCYACHGVVDLEHTNDPSLVHLSKKRPHSPKLIGETCGQCHIRTGKSKASRLPYANNYVIGDDLFSDFQVDFSAPTLDLTPPRERHILASIKAGRDNDSAETCLSCHNVHRASGRKHRRVAKSNYCFICHNPNNMKLVYNRNENHHSLCGY